MAETMTRSHAETVAQPVEVPAQEQLERMPGTFTVTPEDEALFKDFEADLSQPDSSLSHEQQMVLHDLDFSTPDVSLHTPSAPVDLAPAPRPLPTPPATPIPLRPVPNSTPQTPPPLTESETPRPERIRTETVDTPPPPAPPQRREGPPTDTTERPPQPLSLVMIDQSKDAREFARDAADARLTQELNQGRGFRHFLKNKIWKGNLARNYYINRYTREAQAQIEASQDVLHAKVSDTSLRARAQQATMERFQSDHEEMIDRGRKPGDLESRQVLAANSELSKSLKKAIGDFAAGRILSDDLREEGNRILEDHRQRHGDDLVGEGLVRVNNLIDIGEAVKGSIDHQEALENLRIVMGEARTGARTEARRNLTDKAVELFGKRRSTAWIPEGAIAFGSSVASFLGRAGSSKTIGILTAPFTLGLSLVAPAVVAGFREKSHVKAERTQHSREIAVGEQYDAAAPAPTNWVKRQLAKLTRNRREAMEKTRYETVSAEELTNTLKQRREAILLDDSERPAGKTKDDALREALDALAAIEARTMMSNTQKKDFISYSDIAKVGDERMQLALARAELKTLLTSELDNATKARLGFTGQPDLKGIIDQQAGATIELIKADISKKDWAARRLKAKRIATMAGVAVLTGAAIGVAVQEGVAAIRPSTTGLFESVAHTEPTEGSVHQTLLKGIFSGDQAGGHVPPDTTSPYPETRIGEHGMIALSKDHQLVANGDGTYNMVDPNGKVTVNHLPVGKDGELSPQSQDLLRSKGMHIDPIDNPTYETRQVGFQEFMDTHQADTTHVKRDLWYDNNTPRVFDKNELGLHRGGVNGTGVTADGNYQIRAAMTRLGSFHGKQSADFLELARQGNLKVAVSPTAGTQGHPFLVDMKLETVPEIQKDGSTKMIDVVTADIPKDSLAGQFLSVDANGTLQNEGRYIEIVQTGNLDNNGVQHIRPLATWIGHDRAAELPLQSQVKVPHPQYRITTGGYESLPTFTEGPPSIPIYSRRPLEVTKRRPTPEGRPGTPDRYSPYTLGYEAVSPELLREMEADRMPELRRDPSAKVSLKAGLDWHYSLKKKKDPAYVKYIEDTIKTMPLMGSLDNVTKIIDPILVKANGEEDNIYHTLSLHAQMPPARLQVTQFLLHVNWMDTAESDPVEKAKIDKTKSEIQRALNDFPQLRGHVSQFESVWEKAKFDRGEYGDRLIGHVAQRAYDVAMFAAREAIQAGRMDPDHRILVVKGDADPLGIARDHHGKMLDEFEAHPEVDTFTGGVRWGTHRATDLPGLQFLTSAIEIGRITAQRAHINAFQPTFGVNTAVDMATFGAVGAIGHYSDQKHSAPDDLAIGERVAAARNGVRVVPTATGGYGVVSANALGDDHSYHRHVAGAVIDTAAERFEAKYVDGQPITTIWNTVNQGGHQDRRLGLRPGEKEDLKNNPDQVIERIEKNMSAIITDWLPDERQVASTLAVMLPSPKQLGGKQAYTITRGPDGKNFSLTPEGKKWLIHRLQYNSKGKRDPYGERLARQHYGKRAPRGQRQSRVRPPKGRTAPMIGGLAFTS